MSEPIKQISHISGSGNYQPFKNRLYTHSDSGESKGTKQTSSKYIVDDNLIVYEKYDRYGKLISRVPFSHKPIGKEVYLIISLDGSRISSLQTQIGCLSREEIRRVEISSACADGVCLSNNKIKETYNVNSSSGIVGSNFC
jgi:hypothetical protein